MRDYIIMTDSSCDFPSSVIEELGLEVLPLSFFIEGKEYKDYADGREMDSHAFYEKLRSGTIGTTAALNVGTIQDAMEEIVAQGKDILCISFSSGLSTTYQSACIAGKEIMEAHPEATVAVVDSLAASLGQGMLVYLAAQEKAKGRSLEEVRDFVLERRDHICHWFTVDDLNHLKRGGRISATVALVGTMLQMKPVLHVDDEGHLIPMSKVRGRKASVLSLLDHMEELMEDSSLIFISHGDCEDEANLLGEAIRKRYPHAKMIINPVGPVIGNHSGPGTMALFFQGKHK